MSSATRAALASTAVRIVRFSLVAVFLEGVRRRNPGAVANAGLGFAASYLPRLVERWYDVELRPWQRAYAVTALATHAVGMLGPYEDVWWWDRLTHVHSATLVAGLVHVASRRRGRDPRPDVLAAVVVAGAFWELVEYAIHATARRLDVEPLLVPYGARDTALDLASNLLGALLVVAFGDRFLRNLVRDA